MDIHIHPIGHTLHVLDCNDSLWQSKQALKASKVKTNYTTQTKKRNINE